MTIETLTLSQIRRLYAERLKRDFPDNELKPLQMIENALAAGAYVCLGAVAEGEIAAYAFFVLSGENALLDYLAVEESLRDRGLGGQFLRLLSEGPLRAYAQVLVEVENPDRARDAAEYETRRRRLAFYLRNGLQDTGVEVWLYHVDYRILSMTGEPSPAQVRTIYEAIYRSMLPPEQYARWVRLK